MDEARRIVKRYIFRFGAFARQKGYTTEEKIEARKVLDYILGLFETYPHAPPLVLLGSFRDQLAPAIEKVSANPLYSRIALEIVKDIEQTLIK